jgi:hypothetical protein
MPPTPVAWIDDSLDNPTNRGWRVWRPPQNGEPIKEHVGVRFFNLTSKPLVGAV